MIEFVKKMKTPTIDNGVSLSVGTQLGEALRIDPVIIEKCLGHKMPKIMATYNKNEMFHERKNALNKWGAVLENLVTNSNILPFEQAILSLIVPCTTGAMCYTI